MIIYKDGLRDFKNVVILEDNLGSCCVHTRFCKGVTFIHVLLLLVFLFSFWIFFQLFVL